MGDSSDANVLSAQAQEYQTLIGLQQVMSLIGFNERSLPFFRVNGEQCIHQFLELVKRCMAGHLLTQIRKHVPKYADA